MYRVDWPDSWTCNVYWWCIESKMLFNMKCAIFKVLSWYYQMYKQAINRQNIVAVGCAYKLMIPFHNVEYLSGIEIPEWIYWHRT